MGSASVNPANSTGSNLSDLLQTLSAASPELSSLLSAPNVQASLATASPADIVKLSDAALELQNVDVLFGNTGGTQAGGSLFGDLSGNSTTQTDPLLAALDASLTAPAASALAGTSSATSSSTATGSATTPSAAQAAATAQAQELAALFGTANSSDPLVNILG